jgi:hypothetical protein
MKYFADHIDILPIYAELDNDERTDMPLKLWDS